MTLRSLPDNNELLLTERLQQSVLRKNSSSLYKFLSGHQRQILKKSWRHVISHHVQRRSVRSQTDQLTMRWASCYHHCASWQRIWRSSCKSGPTSSPRLFWKKAQHVQTQLMTWAFKRKLIASFDTCTSYQPLSCN